MEAKSWRDRVRREDELVEQLQNQVSQAAKRRAVALLEGVAELGNIAEVAKDLGKSWHAVNNAIKKNGPAGPTTS